MNPSGSSRTAVVAVGGNALTAEGQAGTFEEITRNAAGMASAIALVVRAGWRVVIVHGNGPQVGALAIQHEEATALVPAQPLHLLTAMTQGQLGSTLVRAVDRILGPGAATAVVSHVEVDPADPAFAKPTKPIGPFVTQAQAPELALSRGWVMAEDAGRGYRRVVASPLPRAVLELAGIRALLAAGQVVVAGGGGGIPVHRGAGGADLEGAEAVVDKDATAAVLAHALGADALLLLTAVDALRLDFGTPAERCVHTLEVADAERHLAAGQFPPGSMGPKVGAAIRFIRAGGATAVITTPPLLAATLAGRPGAGTRILADSQLATTAP